MLLKSIKLFENSVAKVASKRTVLGMVEFFVDLELIGKLESLLA